MKKEHQKKEPPKKTGTKNYKKIMNVINKNETNKNNKDIIKIIPNKKVPQL